MVEDCRYPVARAPECPGELVELVSQVRMRVTQREQSAIEVGLREYLIQGHVLGYVSHRAILDGSADKGQVSGSWS